MKSSRSMFIGLISLALVSAGVEGSRALDSRVAGESAGARAASQSSSTLYLADDFESGMGNWTVSGGDWGLTEDCSFSPTHAMTESPNGSYLPSLNVYATLADPLDLSSALQPTITFWHKWDFDTAGDFVSLERSTDGGNNWFALRSWRVDQPSWTYERVNLYSLAGHSDVRLRFRFYSDADDQVGDGWCVDDIRIEETESATLPYPFVEHFESGLGNWIVNGDDWGLTQGCSLSPTHALSDSPSGPYVPSLDVWATLAYPIDLSSAAAPIITFWHKWDFDSAGDRVSLERSVDGGHTWTALRSWSADQPSWTYERVNLYSCAGFSEVKVRFQLHSDADASVGEGWCVDDIWIGESESVTLPYPFVEHFESGLGNWVVSGDDWGLTESCCFDSTHALTDSPDGAYGILLDVYATLAYPIDLSSAAAPIITFWHKWDFDTAGDYVALQVSVDGGHSWSALRSWENEQFSWTYERVDLSGFVGYSDFKVRFRLYSDDDPETGDGWCVDDIRIGDQETATLSYPFVEHFEGGLGNWIVNGDDWGLTDDCSFSPIHGLTDSPSGSYGPSLDVYATLAYPIDLSTAVAPTITFWHKWDFDTAGDHASLQCSIDGGDSWSTLGSWNGDQPSWIHESLDISGFAGSPDFKIRFRLISDINPMVGDGWCVDQLVIGDAVGTGVGNDSGIPPSITLYQNHPNPFNPSTTISFLLPARMRIVLEIFDIEGRRVTTVEDGIVGEGYQEREWHGRDLNGRQIGSGVYFYRLTAGDEVHTRKLVLLK